MPISHPRAQVAIVVHGCDEPDAAKDQRDAREQRQHCADQARRNEHRGDHIQQGIHYDNPGGCLTSVDGETTGAIQHVACRHSIQTPAGCSPT